MALMPSVRVNNVKKVKDQIILPPPPSACLCASLSYCLIIFFMSRRKSRFSPFNASSSFVYKRYYNLVPRNMHAILSLGLYSFSINAKVHGFGTNNIVI